MISELLFITTSCKLPLALENCLERLEAEYSFPGYSLYNYDGRNYNLWHSSRSDLRKTVAYPEEPGTCYILVYNGAEIGRLMVHGELQGPGPSKEVIHFLSFLFHQVVKESSTSFRLSRLHTLYEISRSANSLFDLSSGMANIFDVVNKFIPFDVGLLYRYQDKENVLELESSLGERLDEITISEQIPVGYGFLGEVASCREPRLFYGGKIKSYLAVPIMSGNTLLGVLAIGTFRAYAYNEQDILSVNILTSQIAGTHKVLDSIVIMKSKTDSMLESMPTGLITIDTDCRISSFNSAAGTLFPGLSPQSIGQHISTMGSSPISDLLLEALQSGRFTENHELQSGSCFYEISCFPFKDEKGVLLGAAASFKDISEVKGLKHELEIKKRLSMVGEMATSLAHEIRNPLSGIRMLVQLLAKELAHDSEKSEYLGVVLEEVERLDAIVSGILEYTRPSASRMSTFRLSSLMDTVLLLLKPQIEQHSTQVHVNVGETMLTADFSKFKQVFLNLIKNGIQATAGREGRIEVRSEISGNMIRLHVSDNGKGISRENIGRIFDPFFTTRESGSGLGLPLVRSIVEEHNGTIEAHSDPPSGSYFVINLPAPVTSDSCQPATVS